MPCAGVLVSLNTVSSTALLTTTLSTAMRVVSGTNRNGTPQDTIWAGSPVPVTAAGDSEIVAAPGQRHRHRADVAAEHERLAAGLDHARARERERGPDRRVAGHRHLL